MQTSERIKGEKDLNVKVLPTLNIVSILTNLRQKIVSDKHQERFLKSDLKYMKIIKGSVD